MLKPWYLRRIFARSTYVVEESKKTFLLGRRFVRSTELYIFDERPWLPMRAAIESFGVAHTIDTSSLLGVRALWVHHDHQQLHAYPGIAFPRRLARRKERKFHRCLVAHHVS